MSRPLETRQSALLAGALVTGWVLHDAAVFLGTPEPALALELVPRSLLAVGAAALLGALLARRPGLLLWSAAALALSVLAIRFAPVHVSAQTSWLVRAGLLATLGLSAARALCARFEPGALRTGMALGLLVCAALAAWRDNLERPVWTLVAGAAAVLALGLVRRRALSAVLTAAVCVAAALPTARLAVAGALPERGHLKPRADSGALGPNLLLVVLDTVRADHLAPYGYERATTPALDAFVRDEATLYTQARSTSSWTLPSHASLFTGLLPALHGATHPRGTGEDGNTINAARVPAQRLRPDVTTLAEILRDAGYRTGAVLGNGAFLDHRFGLDRGYEIYDARPGGVVGDYQALAQFLGLRPQAGQLPYRNAETITDLALAWLDRDLKPRPFFLTLNYMDAHTPYFPPAHTAGRLGAPDPRKTIELYDRELLWIDSQLARVLGALREQGVFDDTVIVVTADHGEALGDHGLAGHNWHLYEELLHVPLYIKPAGGRTAQREDEPVRGTDVFGMALRAVGLEPPPRPEAELTAEWYVMPGVPTPQSIGTARDVVSWFEGGRKLIVTSLGEVEAFDLERDPQELAPLALDEAERAAAVRRARDWWERHPPPADSGVELSDADLERLRELGYAGDS